MRSPTVPEPGQGSVAQTMRLLDELRATLKKLTDPHRLALLPRVHVHVGALDRIVRRAEHEPVHGPGRPPERPREDMVRVKRALWGEVALVPPQARRLTATRGDAREGRRAI